MKSELEIRQKLNRLAKESEEELKNMGFSSQLEEVGYIDYTISNAKKRLGQCCYKKHINISRWLLEIGTDKEIKNTIIHELLHTFKDTNGHDYMWKKYARIVSNYGVYNITRTTSITNIMCNNGIKQEDIPTKMGARYEITCKKCGCTYYKNRMQYNTIRGYERGSRRHTSCGGNIFIVKDLKENKIIINGIKEEL